MTQTPFEEIWRRIVEHQGQTLRTVTGLEFTYRVRGSTFYPSRTEYAIQRTDFETAYQMVPLKGPGSISKLSEDRHMFGGSCTIRGSPEANGKSRPIDIRALRILTTRS